MTITRLWTSTWVAARPIPGAAYMVSAMSRTSFWMSAVNAVTGAATLRSRGSGYSRIGNSAMVSDGLACKMQTRDAESLLTPYFAAV